jgi:nicotinate-nucleotide adenylyltransferase
MARHQRRAGQRAPCVGIFGGTFDPVHIGHLRCVEEAREILGLDRILLVPAADPPHKRGRSISPATHRLAMLRSAVRAHPAFRVSTIEIDRAGASFTIDTLRQIRADHPTWNLTLLMGTDAFAEIATWKEYLALFDIADFGVFSRPSGRVRSPRMALPVAVRSRFRYASDRNALINQTGKRVSFLSVSALDISATDIRSRVRHGRSIRFLVPDSVERYIEREHLYRAGSTPV